MTIETKYNINDIVWFLPEATPVPVLIESINLTILFNSSMITYNLVGFSGYYSEKHLFKTKEDLLQSL
jgi:hypothetical protein